MLRTRPSAASLGPDASEASSDEAAALLLPASAPPPAAAAAAADSAPPSASLRRVAARCLMLAAAGLLLMQVYARAYLSADAPPRPPLRGVPRPDRYTVRVNTFRRLDLLREALAHWRSCGPDAIAEVTVVWSDTENEPPPLESLGVADGGGVPVRYVGRTLLLLPPLLLLRLLPLLLLLRHVTTPASLMLRLRRRLLTRPPRLSQVRAARGGLLEQPLQGEYSYATTTTTN